MMHSSLLKYIYIYIGNQPDIEILNSTEPTDGSMRSINAIQSMANPEASLFLSKTMADGGASEYVDEEVSESTIKSRGFVYRELMATEKDYIRDLNTIIDVSVVGETMGGHVCTKWWLLGMILSEASRLLDVRNSMCVCMRVSSVCVCVRVSSVCVCVSSVYVCVWAVCVCACEQCMRVSSVCVYCVYVLCVCVCELAQDNDRSGDCGHVKKMP